MFGPSRFRAIVNMAIGLRSGKPWRQRQVALRVRFSRRCGALRAGENRPLKRIIGKGSIQWTSLGDIFSPPAPPPWPSPALPGAPAFAQGAAAPTGQSPGWFRYKVGDITVTAIGDGFVQRPLDGFIRNVPLADVQKSLADQGLATSHIRVPYTSLVLNTGSRVVLLDTGNGQFAPGAIPASG